MQHRLTHNLKYVNWCRLSPETQISSTDCLTNKTRLDTVELHQFIISCQVLLNFLLMPLVTQLIAGHTLAVSLCIIYAERHFSSFPSFQLHKTWRSLWNTKLCSSTVWEQVIMGYRSTERWARQDTNLQQTDRRNFHCYISQWRHVLSTVTLIFAVLLAGNLQSVEILGLSTAPCHSGDI